MHEIRAGDRVAVNFNAQSFTLSSNSVVMSRPICVGDYWTVVDEETGVLHYISEPCTITKLTK